MKELSSLLLVLTSFIVLAIFCITTTPANRVLTYSETDAIAKNVAVGSEWYKNGAFDVNDIDVDTSGNIYVVTNYDVHKFSPTWQPLEWFGSFTSNVPDAETIDGVVVNPAGIGIDAAGNLYVPDSARDDVQKLTGSGGFITKWGSFGTGSGQFRDPTNIYVSADGTSYVVDSVNKRIQKFASNGTLLLTFGEAGTGDGQFEGTVSGISVDSTGHIFVSEIGTVDRINEFDATGTYVTRFGSTGTGDGQFNEPYGLAHDSSDNLYVTDTSNGRIQKFDSSNTYVWQFGSVGTGNEQFTNARDLDVDTAGNIYVVDRGVFRARKFSSTGTYISGTSIPNFSADMEPGEFQFAFYTTTMATDAQGNVYIPDIVNNRVQKFDKDGNFLFMFGSYGTGDGQFYYPIGVALDSSGNIYVVDVHNDRIQKFGPSGNFITKFGTAGGGDGQFNAASGITITSDGSVFVADRASASPRIQRFTSNGTFVSSFSIQVGTECAMSGFCSPEGITHDAADNLYVVDSISNRVKKFTSTGTYISSFSIGSTEQEPSGIALDQQGNIYVALTDQRQIAKFDPEGNLITNYGSPGWRLGQYCDPMGVVLDNNPNPNMYVAEVLTARVQKSTFDRTSAAISVNQTDGQTMTSSTVNITGTVTDALTPVTSVRIQIDGTGSWIACTANDGSFNEISEPFTCTITGMSEGDHFISLISTDSRGNTNSGGNIETVTFTVAAPSPSSTVTATPTPTTTVTLPLSQPATSSTPPVIVASTVIPTIKGSSIVCPEFISFGASQTIVEKGNQVRFTWTTRNTATVRTTLTSTDLPANGEYVYKPDQTMSFTFIADNGDCVAKKQVTISVVETLPWTNTITVGTTVLAVEAVLAIQQPAMFGNLWLSFAAFVDRKKKLAWGVVYDAASKKPLPRTIIRLLTQEGTVVDTVVSDSTGAFKLRTRMGTFTISAIHPSYKFPSLLVKESTDGGYSNVYHGTQFTINNTSEDILFSIPLDPLDISEVEKIKVRTRSFIQQAVDVSSLVLMIAGFSYSVYVAFIHPHIYNYIILGIYTLLAIAKIILSIPKKASGQITLNDGTPAKGIELGLYDTDFGNLLYRTFTDNNGLYSFVVPNKSYTLKLMDERYSIIRKAKKLKGVDIPAANQTENIKIINEDLSLE